MSEGSTDYTRKVILYAKYNDTFIPVLVDSEGNIVSVFKGDYFGALQTVKVDSEGRIIALITDELDIYGNKVIVGNAELAVRLGSEKFFDRRGDVFLIDNFEAGSSKWELGGGGAGNAQTLTTDKARSGGYSIKLTGGSDGELLARMYNYFPYPVLSKWGFETHFSIGPGIDKLYFLIRQETGIHAKLASILYDRTNQKLQYLDSSNIYQDIQTSFLLYENTYLFHVFKLVADLENFKYVRLITNETEYDLSAYDMYSFSNIATKHLKVAIYLYSRSGNNDSIYVDNVIITQNEPG
jgi:hypothetical protein